MAGVSAVRCTEQEIFRGVNFCVCCGVTIMGIFYRIWVVVLPVVAVLYYGGGSGFMSKICWDLATVTCSWGFFCGCVGGTVYCVTCLLGSVTNLTGWCYGQERVRSIGVRLVDRDGNLCNGVVFMVFTVFVIVVVSVWAVKLTNGGICRDCFLLTILFFLRGCRVIFITNVPKTHRVFW